MSGTQQIVVTRKVKHRIQWIPALKALIVLWLAVDPLDTLAGSLSLASGPLAPQPGGFAAPACADTLNCLPSPPDRSPSLSVPWLRAADLTGRADPPGGSEGLPRGINLRKSPPREAAVGEARPASRTKSVSHGPPQTPAPLMVPAALQMQAPGEEPPGPRMASPSPRLTAASSHQRRLPLAAGVPAQAPLQGWLCLNGPLAGLSGCLVQTSPGAELVCQLPRLPAGEYHLFLQLRAEEGQESPAGLRPEGFQPLKQQLSQKAAGSRLSASTRRLVRWLGLTAMLAALGLAGWGAVYSRLSRRATRLPPTKAA